MRSSRFSSLTHLHIYAIINTIIKYKFRPENIIKLRLLDVGCGNGVMLSTLLKELPQQHPDIEFEFYGLDVDDHSIQQKGYFSKTIALLESSDSEINWQNHLKLIASKESWPFEDNFFDLIFSNQVMEHVFNQSLVLSEIHRTLQPNGFSFHLYPLKHYWYEGHLFIPFVHKFKSWTSTYYWIKWGTYLGFGTYQKHKKAGLTTSVNDYAEKHADYMTYQVNYQTAKQISDTAKYCRLKSSFDFTSLYYKQKIRSVFKLAPLEVYKKKDLMSAGNSFCFFFLKYVSGITLLLRKKDSF